MLLFKISGEKVLHRLARLLVLLACVVKLDLLRIDVGDYGPQLLEVKHMRLGRRGKLFDRFLLLGDDLHILLCRFQRILDSHAYFFDVGSLGSALHDDLLLGQLLLQCADSLGEVLVLLLRIYGIEVHL